MSFLSNNLKSLAEIRRDLTDLAWETTGEICPKTLMGACAISAKMVYKFLKSNNIDCKIIHNDGHFWCRSMGYTIDLTISQFESSIPGVYIESEELENKFDFYNNAIVLEGDLTQEYLESIRWPEYQSPFTYYNEE
jgi:hypothetical protein